MKAYFALFACRFQALLQYRAAAVAGFATQLFWGGIRIMIFMGFYAAGTGAQPMTLGQVVDYVWLGQATLVIAMFGPDPEIRGMIRQGTIAYEMLRPADLYGLWLARAVSLRAAPLALRAVPLMVLAHLFFGLSLPASPAIGAAWVVVTCGAVLLSASIAVLITITLLWTVAGDGVMRLAPALIWLLSGLVIPLPLFPDSLQPLLAFLPFRGLIDAPVRLYLGHIPVTDVWKLLVHQAVWFMVFVGAGRLLLARGTGRLVVQGG